MAAAVSGGADSVALLYLLLELQTELGIVLSVAHVNHNLRGEESDEDARFVAELAKRHGLELHLSEALLKQTAKLPVHTKEMLTGIEACAREVRYSFFRQLARDGYVSKIATAHTLDDQAETVLLRIFRGTGVRGLSGIHPRIVFEEKGHAFGELIRPLLAFRHGALQDFLRKQRQAWREDSSNRNTVFLRNRLRHRLLPLIAEEFGEPAIEHMAELAEIARAEEEHWEQSHPEIRAATLPSLPVTPLLALPLASQRRLVRAWLEATAPDLGVSFRLIEQALDLARGELNRGSSTGATSNERPANERPAARRLELPGRKILRVAQQSLVLDSHPARSAAADYQYALTVPGTVEVPELGACIAAQLVDVHATSDEQRCQLLDTQQLPQRVLIRNWRPGDRYWPAHTAAPRKVKELLSDRHATGIQKKLWPVAVSESSQIVWMRGFAVPAAFRAQPGASQAIWIREIAGML
ncbi:MAG: tRNA lysidine(34) synthetase TilS [Terriglobales bacterium]